MALSRLVFEIATTIFRNKGHFSHFGRLYGRADHSDWFDL